MLSNLRECQNFEMAMVSPSNTVNLPSASGTSTVASVGEKRHWYSRERKPEVLAYYYQTAKQNKYRTCQKFAIDKKCLHRWIASKEKLQKGSKGAKRIGSKRRVLWPDVEETLLEEFKEIRQKV